MVLLAVVQFNIKRRPIWISKSLYTFLTMINRKYEGFSDDIQYSVTNIEYPNKIIGGCNIFLMEIECWYGHGTPRSVAITNSTDILKLSNLRSHNFGFMNAIIRRLETYTRKITYIHAEFIIKCRPTSTFFNNRILMTVNDVNNRVLNFRRNRYRNI